MIKITTSIIVLAMLFSSCTEIKEGTKVEATDSIEKNEGVVSEVSNSEMYKEGEVKDQTEMTFTPFSEHANYLSNTLIEQTCEYKHKEICEDGGVSGGVQVKVCYFRPAGWEYDFAYCQVNYISDEAKEYTQFLFYPNENGHLNSDQFTYIENEDLPCIDCQLKDIKIENDEVIGVFYDFMGPDTDIFTKVMDYNFAEMTVYWVDK